MNILGHIIWALVVGFAGIRIAAIISTVILLEGDLLDVEQAKELYREFVRLEYLRRKDDDKWGRKR